MYRVSRSWGSITRRSRPPKVIRCIPFSIAGWRPRGTRKQDRTPRVDRIARNAQGIRARHATRSHFPGYAFRSNATRPMPGRLRRPSAAVRIGAAGPIAQPLWRRNTSAAVTVESAMLRASVVCAALVLASPAPAQTLRIGLQADPATLDPAQSVSVVDRVVMAAVCDKLIELDAKLAYVPQLATEWAWAADGLSLTLKLRTGV